MKNAILCLLTLSVSVYGMTEEDLLVKAERSMENEKIAKQDAMLNDQILTSSQTIESKNREEQMLLLKSSIPAFETGLVFGKPASLVVSESEPVSGETQFLLDINPEGIKVYDSSTDDIIIKSFFPEDLGLSLMTLKYVTNTPDDVTEAFLSKFPNSNEVTIRREVNLPQIKAAVSIDTLSHTDGETTWMLISSASLDNVNVELEILKDGKFKYLTDFTQSWINNKLKEGELSQVRKYIEDFQTSATIVVFSNKAFDEIKKGLK